MDASFTKDKARADEEKTGEQGTWSVHPDQLVLTAPTMSE
jgi:hypothetical protein